MTLVLRAKTFATAAHAAVGQTRKYTGEPYIVHPAAVARIVESVEHTQPMVAAAWLHDVVEDTAVTIDLIREEFGVVVADLVHWLTDQSMQSDGNRAARKEIDRRHSSSAPPEAQTIKLADIIDNTQTIEAHDPDFAVVFRREKRLLLSSMNRGDAGLMRIAMGQLEGFT